MRQTELGAHLSKAYIVVFTHSPDGGITADESYVSFNQISCSVEQYARRFAYGLDRTCTIQKTN